MRPCKAIQMMQIQENMVININSTLLHGTAKQGEIIELL